MMITIYITYPYSTTVPSVASEVIVDNQYVIVRPLSTVGYTSVVASVIHSRQWSN